MSGDLPPAYVKLIDELTQQVRSQKPDDMFQFCSNFMQKKLEIQRAQLVAIAKGHQNAPPVPAPKKEVESSDSSDDDYHDPPYDHEPPDYEFSDSSADDGFAEPPPNIKPGRRPSVSAESIDPNQEFVKVVIPKTEEQHQRIEASIRNNFLFRNLSDELYTDVVNAMAEKKTQRDEVVIQQGAVGDFFYVVETGALDVFVSKDRGQTLGVKVTDYGPGGSFGELALMYNAPRAATVICTEDSVLWALDRVSFQRILMESTSKKRQMYEKFLEEVPLLMSLVPYERSKIADALETISFDDKGVVITQGDVGDQFYIIESGEAVVTQLDASGQPRELGRLGKGDYFGELALLTDKPRAATITATGKLKCATLGKKAFVRLLGPVVDIIKRNAQNYEKQQQRE